MTTNIRDNSSVFNTNISAIPRYYVPSLGHRLRVAICCIGCVVAFLALTGNTLILYLKKRENTNNAARALRRSVMPYFVASLAWSDILSSLISLPVTITQLMGGFPYTDLTCTVARYLGMVFPVITINNLVVIGIERYASTFHPLAAPSRRVTVRLVVAAWLVGALVTLVLASTFRITVVNVDQYKYIRVCRHDNTVPAFRAMILVFLCCEYVVPSAVLIIAGIRIKRFLNRRQTRVTHSNQSTLRANAWRYHGNRMFVPVAFTFVFPYMAFFAYHVVNSFVKPQVNYQVELVVRFLACVTAYANGALNPIFCFYFMKNMRQMLKTFLRDTFARIRIP